MPAGARRAPAGPPSPRPVPSRPAAATGGRRPPAGLCDSCRHQRLVRTGRGSEFSLCERSRVDPAYARYPRVPVRACPGFEEREG